MAVTIRDKAAELEMDPDLAEAQMTEESHGNPNAVSPKGARGRMQVMPGTAAEVTAETGETDPDKVGLRYMKSQLEAHKDKGVDQVPFALAGYNAGPGRVKHVQARVAARGADPNDFYSIRDLLPKETQNYVHRIMERLKGNAKAATPPDDSDLTGGQSDADLMSANDADLTSPPEDLSSERGMLPTPGEDVSVTGTLKRTLAPLGRGLKHTFIDEPTRKANELADTLRDPDTGFGTKVWEGGKAAIEAAGTAAMPEVAIPAKVIGADVIGAGGTKEQGEGAETAAGIVGALPSLTRTVRKIGGVIRRAPSLGRQLLSDLGASRTAREAGDVLGTRTSGGAVAEGLGKVAGEASSKYLDAQDIADKAGLVTKEGKRVSDLIETHSSMGARISQMTPGTDARRIAVAQYNRLGDHIRQLGAKNQDFLDTWDDARDFYREVAAPTKKTLGRIASARSPERAAAAAVPPKEASQYERLSSVSPKGAAEAKSAFLNKTLQNAMEGGSVEEGGKVNVTKLAASLDPKALDPELAKHLLSDPAAKTAVKAIRKIAAIQKQASTVAATAASAGGAVLGAAGGPGGALAGAGLGFFTSRKIIEAALKSEKVANALYTITKAKQGTPGWQVAASILRDVGKAGLIASRAPLSHGTTKEEE